MTTLATLALLIWLYLLLAHGRFWQAGPQLMPARPVEAPTVGIVVPARDEAPLIGPTPRQDLAGPLRGAGGEEGSSDDTAAIARQVRSDGPQAAVVTVLAGKVRP